MDLNYWFCHFQTMFLGPNLAQFALLEAGRTKKDGCSFVAFDLRIPKALQLKVEPNDIK